MTQAGDLDSLSLSPTVVGNFVYYFGGRLGFHHCCVIHTLLDLFPSEREEQVFFERQGRQLIRVREGLHVDLDEYVYVYGFWVGLSVVTRRKKQFKTLL